MKRILILGASLLQIPTIVEAKKMGMFTIVADMNKNALGKKYADKFYNISIVDKENIFSLAKMEKIDAIATAATDRPMETVAYVSEKLGLNTINMDIIKKSTNKFLMREELRKANIPIPLYAKVEKIDDIIMFTDSYKDMDFILKPANASGSRGVRFISSGTNLHQLKEALDYSLSVTDLSYVLIEEYMPGAEVSVESIMVNGENHVIAITDKITTGDPHFVELGHSQPSQLSEKIQSEIKQIVANSLLALKYKDGVSHVEVKITDDLVRIVEIGLRLGGDCITSDLVPCSTGVNMVRQNLNLAAKLPVDIDVKKRNSVAIRFIEAKQGKIKNIRSLDLTENEDIKSIVFTKKNGDVVFGTKQSGDRIGHVICKGKTPKIALENCEEALKKIEIIYE